MARTDWAALLTEPAKEYLAHTELHRFGLTVYLPQLRKRFHTPTGKYVMRHYPLFPRYVLIRYGEAHHPSVRMARGVVKTRPLLADDDGRPWRAPTRIIDAVMLAEHRGAFDEILHKGDQVTLKYGALATVRSVLASEHADAAGMIELLTPLFGGVRAIINASKVVHA